MLVSVDGPPLKSFNFLPAYIYTLTLTFLCQIRKGKDYRIIVLNRMVLISLFAYKTKQKA